MTIEVVRQDAAPGTASLANRAYEAIRQRLILLDIRPGDPINDVALAAELGVGRTPVREALKRLETDHLVISYPRRGTFATAVDVTELGAISDIRRLLEPHAARRAAENASRSMRDRLRAQARHIRGLDVSPDDPETFLTEDMAVHRLIYAATGNPHLEDVLIRYDNLATRIWCLVIERLPDLGQHIREHSALLEAIAEGEAATAETLTAEHLAHFEDAIRGVL
ncbi:GntR family transcriptional regulator [Micropruina sp.]|uniref:GntR family transcriptional regulator n=1 Tax=Micropruina sp. TaxID=2737536 RepID=UPI002629C789|nr:GntR family transcriptional regulator [Micropruina sp.]